MNPLLPDNCFLPDAEAHLMSDGRLYIYGSWDISGSSDYCSREVHCFSTDDMVSWTDHGAVFRNDESFFGLPWAKESMLYAPDAIEKNRKYYLYVCGSRGEEGVAVADSPTGPFSVAEKIELADRTGIDPAIFVDDDGKAYYLWGQFSLNGAELAEDMKTIIQESVKKGIATEWEHGFHEGASLRRRGDKYYLVYTDVSRGKATCLAYAVSDSPLGPYKKGGVIIDNVYCDPSTWNNHGSINNLGDKWYVFYHRSSQNGRTCRRVCAEPIEFDENGMIKEVPQTSSGAEKALDARNTVHARTACRLMGKCHITVRDGHEVLLSEKGRHWGQRDWAEYKYIDFGEGGLSELCVTACGKGSVSFVIEGNTELCSLVFECDTPQKFTAKIRDVKGVHTLWLFLDGSFTLSDFKFR